MHFVAAFVRGRGIAPDVVAAWSEELRPGDCWPEQNHNTPPWITDLFAIV
jgi:hypothetical protein